MAGLIHIYCGDGKGETTAALGLAVRAAGSGKKVLLLQFFKDGKSSEFTALQDLQGLEVIPQTRSFGFSWTLSDSEKKEAAAYYSGLLEAAFARAEDMVGSVLTVMIEGKVADEDVYVARTYRDAPGVDGYLFVHTSAVLMTGDLVQARVTGCNEYDLVGEIWQEEEESKQ